MTLESLLKQIGDQKHPPVERWNPEFCGDIDMEIRRNGDWYYQGTPIGRPAMVKLFASILKREGEHYYLVTPVEKVGIRVEATPFIATTAEYVEGTWIVTNNLGESAPLDAEHPLDALSDSEQPVMTWRRNLPARIHQNLMYHWQTWALEQGGPDEDGVLWLDSAGERFKLAEM
ncbi:DUF1285 domain-containing protein [Saccharospirillum salsuginis]|uniref:DUF1285 domain-containing protein n=1 Tax=Saccharospirillum salsuginis TaxID=418750 RepID=A0A918K7T3_9GAMM|nr:DUF1285 domain-containing protein [Saccharospirillum salsuginis]GGX51940.1 hypothetical protein GCM10007392_19070 [Saccharospirillum salsuginis]